MSYDDHDPQIEELLRSSLAGEADSVQPAGDGLTRIQSRITTRRNRRVWLRPVAAVGAVAIVGGAGVTAYALTRPDGGNSTIVPAKSSTPTPDQTQPAVISTSTPTAAALPAYPNGGMYPFASATQEHTWELQGGDVSQPWVLDSTMVAQNFVRNFLQISSVQDVVGVSHPTGADVVTLGRKFNDGSASREISVTQVRLVRYGKAWVVVGATDPASQPNALQIDSPATGASVPSPVKVSGPAYGVDEAIQLSVRSTSNANPLGPTGHVSFGNGTGEWSATLSFTPAGDPAGAIVATEASAADGGPARIAVTGVRFADAAGSFPAYFYGIKDNRVNQLSARDGASLKYLTPANVTASDPQLVGSTVYFLAGPAPCGNSLLSVSTSGGTPNTVATSQSGYIITGYGVAAESGKTALFEAACNTDQTHPQGKLVMGSTTTDFNGFPPVVIGDPTWDPSGQYVDAIVKTGTQSSIVRYPASGGQTSSACNGYDFGSGEPLALEVDSAGTLWFVAETGSAMQVESCANGVAKDEFSVAGSEAPVDLDVTADGRNVLLTDQAGVVRRWSVGDSQTTPLAPSSPQQHVTW